MRYQIYCASSDGGICVFLQSVSQWCAKWSALIAVGNSLNESDSHE